MAYEEKDKELLIRIDERVKTLVDSHNQQQNEIANLQREVAGMNKTISAWQNRFVGIGAILAVIGGVITWVADKLINKWFI